MHLIPSDDFLLVELVEEKSEFALPEGAAREEFRIGKVLEVGEQAEKHYKDLTGKIILFERYGPLSVNQFNEKWFLVRTQYILGILED